MISKRADLSIFFDESGKGNQPNQLIGGLSLPTKIYHNETFTPLHELNSKYSYHWSSFDGDSKMRSGLIQLFNLASPLAAQSNLIFIRYSQQKLREMSYKHTAKLTAQQKQLISGIDFVDETIYTKIPERIMYGLLRIYGDIEGVTASLYVERASEYIRLKLAEKLKLQLNIHSLYR